MYFSLRTYDAKSSEVIENVTTQLYQAKESTKKLIFSHDISDKKTYESALE